MFIPLADLHAPLTPILREVIARTRWRRSGLVLDIACGTGLKHALFTTAVGPQGRVIGIDIDRATLRIAREQHIDAASAWIAGDALSLPIRDSCADGVACIAALGLLLDEAEALRELRRVLAPDGTVLVVTAAQCWSAVHPWPPALASVLAQAHRRALGARVSMPSSELGDPLTHSLLTAGLMGVATRAFLLEPPSADPLEAELAVAPWSLFRPCLAPYLSAADLAHTDTVAAAPEDVELVPVLLAGMGSIKSKGVT